MTRKEWVQMHYPENTGEHYAGGVASCPHKYSGLRELDPMVSNLQGCCFGLCGKCWNTEIPNTEKETKMIDKKIDDNGNVLSIEAGPHILDSGDRTEFESGAVRDMREGKGRCDLMPLGVVGQLFNDKFFNYIEDFQRDGEVVNLYKAIDFFSLHWTPVVDNIDKGTLEHISYATMCLEVAKHFEEGAKKYGDNNWRKGIPAHVYIDSAVRHYLKYIAGWNDEPHDRAVAWNLMCCIWTCDNKPELNDYAAKKEDVQ